jgi:hypothetical protein
MISLWALVPTVPSHVVQTKNTIDVLALFRKPLSNGVDECGSNDQMRRGRSGMKERFRWHSWVANYCCNGGGWHFQVVRIPGGAVASVSGCRVRRVLFERLRTHHLPLLSDIRALLSRRGRRQTGTMRRSAMIAGLFLMLPILASATPASSNDVEHRGGTAIPFAARDGVMIAEASCASLCRQRHNQCRIATRGAPRCDSELQRCLKGCLGETKRR